MRKKVDIIRDILGRNVWEIGNMLRCIEANDYWDDMFCGSPVWKHVYHTLHSLDQWFINPNDYTEPVFHKVGQNVLDTESSEVVGGKTLINFLESVKNKLYAYTDGLDDERLNEIEGGRTRFERIIAQFKHLNAHMGIIMAYLYQKTGKWVAVYPVSRPLSEPDENGIYFD